MREKEGVWILLLLAGSGGVEGGGIGRRVLEKG